MNPLPFVVAAYAVVVGGTAAYAAWLWRRLAAARWQLDEATPTVDRERRDA
ncbi:MAG TPA: hypothetical protein VFX49_14795 [Chloroflexota bacterium]|nr:hypothetical protein [Chloroflexota bacterium]